jgi:hypothetical protein
MWIDPSFVVDAQSQNRLFLVWLVTNLVPSLHRRDCPTRFFTKGFFINTFHLCPLIAVFLPDTIFFDKFDDRVFQMLCVNYTGKVCFALTTPASLLTPLRPKIHEYLSEEPPFCCHSHREVCLASVRVTGEAPWFSIILLTAVRNWNIIRRDAGRKDSWRKHQ